MTSETPLHVLLVEDNDADATLLMELFREAGFPGALRWVQDGLAAVDYLLRRGEYREAPRPQAVLLDLGLPQVDGHEVLRQLRASPERADVPVIVLSTSSNPEDLRVAKEAGADAYLTKAPDFDGLEALVRHLLEWEFPRLGILAA